MKLTITFKQNISNFKVSQIKQLLHPFTISVPLQRNKKTKIEIQLITILQVMGYTELAKVYTPK